LKDDILHISFVIIGHGFVMIHCTSCYDYDESRSGI